MTTSSAIHDAYDLSSWSEKIIDHPIAETLPTSSWNQDGIHRLMVADGNSIDLYLKNYELLSERANTDERVMLVGFSGAITLRSQLKGPFFSGLRIAEQFRLPVLAVADPSISKSRELGIAWYAGNEGMPNMSEILGTHLDRLARHYGARLVLFGGSAGGFGALSVLPYLTGPASCVVWNPQTSITQYIKTFVIYYLKNAFPTRHSKLNVNSDVSREELATWLDNEGVNHDLQRDYKIPENVKLLFLQNKTDWHVSSHAIPFLTNVGFEIDANNLANQRVGDKFVHFGTFGRGHSAPNKEIIMASLKWSIENCDTHPLLTSLEDKNIDASAEEIKFKVAAILDQSEVLASIDVVPGIYIKPVFAFYLFVDGKRVSIKSYSPDNTVVFEVDGNPKKVEIIGYVMDNGKRESKKINVAVNAERHPFIHT